MNAVDLNITLVSGICHNNFKLFVRRASRLATGGNETCFYNLCFRTAGSQARGGEVRPNLFESNSEEGIGLQADLPLSTRSLTGSHFGSNPR